MIDDVEDRIFTKFELLSFKRGFLSGVLHAVYLDLRSQLYSNQAKLLPISHFLYSAVIISKDPASIELTVDSIGLPAVVTDCLHADWRRCGSGVFTWSVFKLYRASLYAPDYFDPAKPFALDLFYLRTIQATQIVETTMSEIERLRPSDSLWLSAWSVELLKILPDVKLSDRLIGLFLPLQGVKFFSARAPLGDVMSPEFASAFAAIWLDPQTRSQTLRAALLGLEQE